MRILGIDTAVRHTGIGVVDRDGEHLSAVAWGVIVAPDSLLLSEALRNLRAELRAVLRRHRPEVAAIEGIFFCRNARVALSLGEARGVVIETLAEYGCPVYEYAPRRVKQSVTGRGGAGKEAVQFMVRALLSLSETPPQDAADALALAVCHAHQVGAVGQEPPRRL